MDKSTSCSAVSLFTMHYVYCLQILKLGKYADLNRTWKEETQRQGPCILNDSG